MDKITGKINGSKLSTIAGRLNNVINAAELQKEIDELKIATDLLSTNKQDKLVSGETIRTVDNISLLGSGNIPLKTINGKKLSESGDIRVKQINGISLIGDHDIYLKTLEGISLTEPGNINFKTINEQSIIGAGNIDFKTFEGLELTGTGNIQLKTINGEKLLAPGNIEVYLKEEVDEKIIAEEERATAAEEALQSDIKAEENRAKAAESILSDRTTAIEANYVTTDADQTISSTKTFTVTNDVRKVEISNETVLAKVETGSGLNRQSDIVSLLADGTTSIDETNNIGAGIEVAHNYRRGSANSHRYSFYNIDGIYHSTTQGPRSKSFELLWPWDGMQDGESKIIATTDDPNLIEVTYFELKALRDNSKLIPGRFYRITDYTCTTAQENTSSAGHAFDIIVRADDVNKLSEEASAIQHKSDTYFANSNLSAWKLKYCLDNDTTRFAWADNSIIIEFYEPSETVPFNIYPEYEPNNVDSWIDNIAPVGGPSDRDEAINLIKSWGEDGYVCIQKENHGSSSVDMKFALNKSPQVGDITKGITFTLDYMGEYVSYSAREKAIDSIISAKGIIYRMIDEFNNDIPYDFKNILFTSSGKYTNAYTFSYTENSIIKDASLLGLVKFCYNNVMKECFRHLNQNVFYSTSSMFSCYSNTFRDECSANTFGSGCANNTFGRGCTNNTFSNYCFLNTFGSTCQFNTFGEDCSSNTFRNTCSSNTFGNNCSANTFGEGCSSNVFGTNCFSNVFGNSCGNIIFGNSLSAINYCMYNIIDNGCKYLCLTTTGTASSSNQLQNIHIHSGVQGTSTSDRKTITVARNLSYTTDVYPAGSTEMFI